MAATGMPVSNLKVYQGNRAESNMSFLFGGGVRNNEGIHKVHSTIPTGMVIGDVVSLRDGRNFVLCKNKGAAAVTCGKNVSANVTVYDIDGTNEIVIPTTDYTSLEWYLGGSGTTTTSEAMIGAMICVISGTGAKITRRIVGFDAYTYVLSGVNKTAYRVRLDIALADVELDATTVIKVVESPFRVTLYDGAAAHNALLILGGSASDSSVAQDSYFFVLVSGAGAMEVDGAAFVAGQEVKGADGAGTGDGNGEVRPNTEVVPAIALSPIAAADGTTMLVWRLNPTGCQI